MSEQPSRLGQYTIVDVIQVGAAATVYKGMQPSLARTVAIKVLQRTDPVIAAQFKRNAWAIAQLEHHNILPIYDYGEQDGQLYVVMQYVAHETTLQHLLGTPVEPLAGLGLIASVLDALAYAHGHGVLHRDIKPSNVLLPLPDWPVLSDFGVIDSISDQQLTLPPIPIGNALYMAPEHAEGLPVDQRTDLYALGTVLYHLLVGRPPFEGKTALALLRDHAYTPLPLPRSLNPTLHPAVEQVLLRALAKQPEQRFPTALAMAESVRDAARKIAQGRQYDQLGPLYQAGLQAFGAGEWTQAVAQFQKVQALEPGYEDTAALLEFARTVQERARREGEARLAQLQRRASTHVRLVTPPVPAPATHYQTQRLSLGKATTTTTTRSGPLVLDDPAATPDAEPLAPPRWRGRIVGALIALALIMLLVVLLSYLAE